MVATAAIAGLAGGIDEPMKLYYAPGACSLASHIVAREAGVELELVKVDMKAKTLPDGSDFHAVSAKGYVPALLLDEGEVLTEGPAIVQYLGDRNPAAGVVPAAGTLERYRLQEMLGYINSELHKTWSAFFNPHFAAEARSERTDYLRKRYGLVEKQLEGREYLLGSRFTAADAYLFVVTNWAGFLKVDLSGFPNVMAFQRRVASRPAVQAAMKAEGLLK
jgi:glutathione S-transferase